MDLFACFNVPEGAGGAEAEIFLRFFNAGGAFISDSPTATLVLDNDPATWEHLTIGDFSGISLGPPDLPAAVVPIGTQFVEAHFLYDNASLGDFAGYADKTHLEFEVIPEPSTVLLVLIGAVSLLSFLRLTRR